MDIIGHGNHIMVQNSPAAPIPPLSPHQVSALKKPPEEAQGVLFVLWGFFVIFLLALPKKKTIILGCKIVHRQRMMLVAKPSFTLHKSCKNLVFKKNIIDV
jgi:hypothetical protein